MSFPFPDALIHHESPLVLHTLPHPQIYLTLEYENVLPQLPPPASRYADFPSLVRFTRNLFSNDSMSSSITLTPMTARHSIRTRDNKEPPALFTTPLHLLPSAPTKRKKRASSSENNPRDDLALPILFLTRHHRRPSHHTTD